MKTVIKPFEALGLGELYSLLKLRSEVFVVEQTCPYLDPDGNDPQGHHMLVYNSAQTLIGCLRILPKGTVHPEYASIGRVVVAPSHRGQGLSRPMLEQAINYAAAQFGACEIFIQAQAHLTGLYGSVGFEPVSEVYPEDGIPHVDMLLRLP
jgi:ElaA protein